MMMDSSNYQLHKLLYGMNLISHLSFFTLQGWFILNVFQVHTDLILSLMLNMSLQLWTVLHLVFHARQVYLWVDSVATCCTSVYIIYLLWLYEYDVILQTTEIMYMVVIGLLDVVSLIYSRPEECKFQEVMIESDPSPYIVT